MPACDNIKAAKLRWTQPKLLREKKIVVTAFFIFVSNLAVSALETGQDRKDDPLSISFTQLSATGSSQIKAAADTASAAWKAHGSRNSSQRKKRFNSKILVVTSLKRLFCVKIYVTNNKVNYPSSLPKGL